MRLTSDTQKYVKTHEISGRRDVEGCGREAGRWEAEQRATTRMNRWLKVTNWPLSHIRSLLIYRQGLNLRCAVRSSNWVLTGDIVCPLILASLESTPIPVDSMALAWHRLGWGLFPCLFHFCVHSIPMSIFFHIRLSWSLDILKRFTVPWSWMVSGQLGTAHSPMILDGPWTPWNSSQSHEIIHRCTEHSPIKSCSHHLRWSLDSSKRLTDSSRILYSSVYPLT